jgi:hypothetical protein
MNQTSTALLTLRVPSDIKAWLVEQAACNLSTQNSEIVRALRAQMAATEQRREKVAAN